MSSPAPAERATGAWQSPVDPARYDRAPALLPQEQRALAALAEARAAGPRATGARPKWIRAALARLTTPLQDVLRHSAGNHWQERSLTVHRFTVEMHARQTAFWGWSREDWLAVLRATDGDVRQYVQAVAYLLCGCRDLHLAFPKFKRRCFCWKVFGRAPMEEAVGRVGAELVRWGCGSKAGNTYAPHALSELLLQCGSPRLEDLDPARIAAAYAQSRAAPEKLRHGVRLVARALVGLGVLAALPFAERPTEEEWLAGTTASRADVPPEWAGWCERWFRTATLAPTSRATTYYYLLKVGRWVRDTHPRAADPAAWTRELAVAYVAAVDRMLVGEYSHTPGTFRYAARVGLPLQPRSKDRQLGALRTFVRDLQEWGWIPRRFDPWRALATPKAVRDRIGPDPRVIADDAWAKPLWAGLNLAAEDLPRHPGTGRPWYPTEMARAVAMLWLFAGLRADEIWRLRVGCVRWQQGDVAIPGTGETLPKEAVCLLDVPAHKTGLPFTKPVDRAVGEAIAAWERLRPPQPPFLDAKTGEAVRFLFAYRGMRMSRGHVNRVLIPRLCAKANIPRHDVRGAITSHRARSTVATQLFNAKEPMTLFELQAWLGHRSPEATQHYARITPTRLARAYADAGYFARNVRAIEVLIDQDAVTSGAAAAGAPWRFYDLGHGHCTYDFFDQCPHRLACAKCAFYRPKGSAQALLLEGKANLLRMRQDLPLGDEELAAVEEGIGAYEQLLARLADVPTPAGPTPRELRDRGRPLLPVLPSASSASDDRALSLDALAAAPAEGVPEMEG